MKLSEQQRSQFLADSFKDFANNRLEEFRQYTQEIEEKFESDKAGLAQRYDEAVASLSAEEANMADDYFSDEYYTIEETFIGQYRKSTLVSLYSFLEHSMNSLCKHLKSKNQYTYALDDLAGNGIVRARSFLEKSAGADFTALNTEWSKLQTLNKVRNCIVHCEGDVNASAHKSLAELVKNTQGLSLRSEYFIAVERTYINECITTLEAFLEGLYKQVL